MPLLPLPFIISLGEKSNESLTTVMNCPVWNILGQNGADFHFGTIRVPLACSFMALSMTRAAKRGGGTHQLTSFSQVCLNASTPSEVGHPHLELKRMHFEL